MSVRLIHDIKDDPVCQVSNQEPKHPLCAFLLDPPISDIILLWESSLQLNNIIHDIKDGILIHVSGYDPSTSSKFPLLGPPTPLLDTVSLSN